jgi:hypothetical protein
MESSGYCDNCDNEAVYKFWNGYKYHYLCETCSETFQWGQNHPDAELEIAED